MYNEVPIPPAERFTNEVMKRIAVGVSGLKPSQFTGIRRIVLGIMNQNAPAEPPPARPGPVPLTLTLNKQGIKETLAIAREDGERIYMKHDCYTQDYIFTQDGQDYLMTLTFSYNDGLQDEEAEAFPVRSVEKTTQCWEVIK